MPVSIKGRIILEILEGMVYLTERKVVHQDIKPENILIDKDFHIKVKCSPSCNVVLVLYYIVLVYCHTLAHGRSTVTNALFSSNDNSSGPRIEPCRTS